MEPLNARSKTAASSVDYQPGAGPGLYPRLLGDAWREVHPDVRSLHLDGSQLQARGVFRVRHGTGWLSRLLLPLLRLPAASEAAEVRLTITAIGRGERWHRTFGGRPMVSTQVERVGGTLGERVGLTEIRFQLRAEDGALRYATVGAAVCVGPVVIPLPSCLAPRVDAWETPAANGGTHVKVVISLPGGGLLISYEGAIERVEIPP